MRGTNLSRDTPVVVAAAIVAPGDPPRLLVAQRAYPAALAGRWELPGGKLEAGEDEPAAVARECAEELQVAVRVGARVGGELPIGDGRVLRVWSAELAAGAVPVAVEHAALRWVAAGELAGLDWLPADRPLVPALVALLAAAAAG